MEHIEKNILEKYIISREDITPGELDIITAHLEQCHYCKDHAEKLNAFYDGVNKELQTEPTEGDKAFADKLLTRNRLALPEKKLALQERVDNALSTFVEIIEPYRRPLTQRIVRYIKIHPLRVASGFSMAAALVFATLMIQPMFKDTNPSYARAKDEFLVVYNKSGEELWRKYIGQLYNRDALYQQINDMPANCLDAVDIDNDGRKEVLATFFWVKENPWGGKLVCFNPDGSIRWLFEPNRKMTFGGEAIEDKYDVRFFIATDLDKDGICDLIVVSHQGQYYPCVIMKLNTSNGSAISEYWHTGLASSILYTDLDKDGISEIIIGATNNGLHQAAIAVLDPRYLSGHSPSDLSHTPDGVGAGTEKFYVTFPRTDLQKFSSLKRNSIKSLEIIEQYLKIIVLENTQPEPLGPIFLFDRNMRCVKVNDEDQFVKYHQQMEAEGKLTQKLNTAYYENLRKGVQYWDGEKFVNYVTMNSLYTKTINLP